MTPGALRVRHAIYSSFAANARAPNAPELASAVSMSLADVTLSLAELQAEHLLVLAPATDNIWMAHPFSAVPTPFRVRARGLEYFANCAWDALAIPLLLDSDAAIDTGNGGRFEVHAGALAGDLDGFIHFPIPPRHFWDNIGFT